jgi:hypothetical protein
MSRTDHEKRDDYRDMIDLPHPTSKRHPRMAPQMRAAQFAPYAALSGHAGAIRRTAKFAELRSRRKIEYNEDAESMV